MSTRGGVRATTLKPIHRLCCRLCALAVAAACAVRPLFDPPVWCRTPPLADTSARVSVCLLSEEYQEQGFRSPIAESPKKKQISARAPRGVAEEVSSSSIGSTSTTTSKMNRGMEAFKVRPKPPVEGAGGLQGLVADNMVPHIRNHHDLFPRCISLTACLCLRWWRETGQRRQYSMALQSRSR